MDDNASVVPYYPEGRKLYKSSRQLEAIRRARATEAEEVPHQSLDEVRRIIDSIPRERNRLLVQLLFDGCLRVSEALGVRPCDIQQSPSGWVVRIMGKGRRPGVAAISPSLGAALLAYCYQQGVALEARIFPVTRGRVHQIVSDAMRRAGVAKPRGVGAVHVLRHSGAIERLARTGNPKAVQTQLRHRSALMTLRYLKTLTAREGLEVQKGVELW